MGEKKDFRKKQPLKSKLRQAMHMKEPGEKGKDPKKEDILNSSPLGDMGDSVQGVPHVVEMWLKGHIDAPPDGVSSVLSNMKNKTNFAAMYSLIIQLGSLPALMEYKKNVEKTLFKDADLENMKTKDLLAMNKQLANEIHDTLDLTRRIANQQDMMDESNLLNNLMNLLQAMPKEFLLELQESLREMADKPSSPLEERSPNPGKKGGGK